MAYKISYKKSASKELNRIPRECVKEILDEIDEKLSSNPYAFKKLSGELKGFRSMRVGDYRVLYQISGDTVHIVEIGHRQGVYG